MSLPNKNPAPMRAAAGPDTVPMNPDTNIKPALPARTSNDEQRPVRRQKINGTSCTLQEALAKLNSMKHSNSGRASWWPLFDIVTVVIPATADEPAFEEARMKCVSCPSLLRPSNPSRAALSHLTLQKNGLWACKDALEKRKDKDKDIADFFVAPAGRSISAAPLGAASASPPSRPNASASQAVSKPVAGALPAPFKTAAASGASKARQLLATTQEAAHKQALRSLALFFFTSGLPLRHLSNPHLRQAFTLMGTALPDARSLVTDLLDECYDAERQSSLSEFHDLAGGYMISCDGWKPRRTERGAPLVAFTVLFPTGRPLLWKVVTASGASKHAQWIADCCERVRADVAHSLPTKANFTGYVTDNTAATAQAMRTLSERDPGLTNLGCAAQGLTLLLRDLGKCFPWVARVRAECAKVCEAISGCSRALRELLETCVRQCNGRADPLPAYDPLAPVLSTTSLHAAALALLSCEHALVRWVSEEEFMARAAAGDAALQAVREIVLREAVMGAPPSDGFFRGLDALAALTGPVVEAVQTVAADRCHLSRMLPLLDKLVAHAGRFGEEHPQLLRGEKGPKRGACASRGTAFEEGYGGRREQEPGRTGDGGGVRSAEGEDVLSGGGDGSILGKRGREGGIGVEGDGEDRGSEGAHKRGLGGRGGHDDGLLQVDAGGTVTDGRGLDDMNARNHLIGASDSRFEGEEGHRGVASVRDSQAVTLVGVFESRLFGSLYRPVMAAAYLLDPSNFIKTPDGSGYLLPFRGLGATPSLRQQRLADAEHALRQLGGAHAVEELHLAQLDSIQGHNRLLDMLTGDAAARDAGAAAGTSNTAVGGSTSSTIGGASAGAGGSSNARAQPLAIGVPPGMAGEVSPHAGAAQVGDGSQCGEGVPGSNLPGAVLMLPSASASPALAPSPSPPSVPPCSTAAPPLLPEIHKRRNFWLNCLGFSWPALSDVAQKLLAMHASGCDLRRDWSRWGCLLARASHPGAIDRVQKLIFLAEGGKGWGQAGGGAAGDDVDELLALLEGGGAGEGTP